MVVGWADRFRWHRFDDVSEQHVKLSKKKTEMWFNKKLKPSSTVNNKITKAK